MTDSKEIETIPTTGGGALMVSNLAEQINTIQLAMSKCMKNGTHYGTIPGCGTKPALLKAGAEKILFMFRMAPKFKIEKVELGNGHREIIVTTSIYDNAGNFLGDGLGSCSTKESKYRWRNSGKVCPECGVEGTILKSKFGKGGFYCFDQRGGCGAQFPPDSDGFKLIANQTGGKVENPDIADQYNTVLKMAKKRSLVDATLTATAASDVFEQDLDEYSLEELEELERSQGRRGKPKTEPPQKKEPAKTAAKKGAGNAKQSENVQEETQGGDNGIFSLEDYKQMSNENKDKLPEWWAGIKDQALKDLGKPKYSLLVNFLTGFHKADIEG